MPSDREEFYTDEDGNKVELCSDGSVIITTARGGTQKKLEAWEIELLHRLRKYCPDTE